MAVKITKRILAALFVLIFTAAIFSMFPMSSADALNFPSFDYGETETLPDPIRGGTYGRAVAIADYDNCLTASEEASLITELAAVADKIHCNIGIIISKNTNGVGYVKYADNFSDEMFEYGSNSVVLLLFNSYNKPEYSSFEDWISTDGKMRKLDKRVDRMLDRIYKKLGEPKGNKYAYNQSTKTYGGYNYYAACMEFAKCVKRYGTSGPGAIPLFFTDYLVTHPLYFLGGLGIALVIAFSVVGSTVKKYKVKKPISAAAYMDRSATRVTNSVDRFIREYTTSVTHSSSSGGHGGGHGGGGHGGGGGHHR
ncbi:MAG: TPM domain-containing protein [Oscillospiraceae bacterium]|nr:TPM domain-containing protein [Oscillospiraceae bacterium]